MALRHVFFAEREASKIPKLADSLALRTVASVGIVGAGTMGIGIAMSFASAGISVVLHDLSAESLTRAAETIRKTYDRSEEHTSELQSLMRISYAVLCLTKK